MFFKLLNDEDVKFCLDHLPKDKTYEDGKNTGVNKQNTESNSVPDEVKKLISSRFYDSFYIDSVYCPNRVSINFYNKYKSGDYYDLHIDSFRASPKSNNVYFDYGWSICLQDEYEGGEFIVETPIGQVGKKLAAGEAIIFPIIYPHGVKEVTKGVRHNIVGWMSSCASYESSFILKNIVEVGDFLEKLNSEQAKMIKVKTELIRNYLHKAWGQRK
tara:strand:+ start:618 stop:1262 length:645 start_codon:yes stop_codon:yes gene_type:complete